MRAMRLDIVYFERYIYRGWILAVALALGLCGMGLLVPAIQGSLTPLAGVAALALLIVGVGVFNYYSASLWVYPDELRIEFGRGLHYAGRRVTFAGLTSVDVVVPAPGLCATGWSMHSLDIHGETCRVAATSSPGAILLRGAGEPFILGTAYPEKLRDAIATHLAKREGLA